MVGRRIGAQASDHALGMPLHAEDGQGLVLQCFDLPVVGVCRRAQAGGEPPDRLMVVAVCLKKAAGQAGDPGAGHRRDRMGDAVMAGNLLEQCAAKKDVDGLDAAANAEYRLAAGAEGAQQGKLFGVAPGVEGQAVGCAALPVKGGVQIAASDSSRPPQRAASIAGSPPA